MLSKLLKQHTALQNEADRIVREYASKKRTVGFCFSEEVEVQKAEVKKIEKNLKKLEQGYLAIREQIYSLEDSIGDMDEDTLQGIVEPLKEDIEEQIEMLDD